MSCQPRLIRVFVFALLLGGVPSALWGQEVSLQVDATEIYADMPFTLSVVLKGFAEVPEPALSEVSIPGAEVRFMGVTPSVSSMTTIINGKRTDSREVTFVHRYRVTVPRAGRYTVAPIVASQDGQSAATSEAVFEAIDVADSDEMRLEMRFPERPVWVGETFAVTLDWLLRKDVQGQAFAVPLFEMGDVFEVKEPQLSGRERTLAFETATKTLNLPFSRDNVTLQGQSYVRFRFVVRVTPLKAGRFEIGAAKVMAQLQVGMTRDRFGFPTARTRVFKAEDRPRTFDVKALPLRNKPASFTNAVGSAFSLEVTADRTVVKVGDPVELRVVVRGDGNMDGLMLARLDQGGGMDPTLFAVPADMAPGETQVSDGVASKVFRVVVRVKSERVREIPPLAFSFFNPERGEYQTVRSQPIALSVTDAGRVGVGDVVSGAAATAPREGGAKGGRGRDEGAGQGVERGSPALALDMGLSEPAVSLRRAWRTRDVLRWVVALYALPFVLLVVLLVWRRQAVRGARARTQRARERELRALLARAEGAPAREIVGELVVAVRGWLSARALPPSEAAGLFERLENASFDPKLSEQPLAEPLRAEVRHLLRRRGPKSSSVVMLLLAGLAVVALGTPRPLWAEAGATVEQARAAYQQAMSETERAARVQAFARAAALFQGLVAASPDAPELMVDWGNAAFGAQQVGHAVLAYKRALYLEPGHPRAQKNLAFVRSTMPDDLPPPKVEKGSLAVFFFINDLWTYPWRLLLGAVLFSLGALLCLPWPLAAHTRRALRLGAVVPLLLWVWSLGALLAEPDHAQEGVVITESTLRAADSPGAAAVLSQALVPGTEVVVVEVREGWTKVQIGDGRQGWVQSGAVLGVVP